MAAPYSSYGLPPSTAWHTQSTVQAPVAEGKYTQTVYTAIREGRYANAIKILSGEIQSGKWVTQPTAAGGLSDPAVRSLAGSGAMGARAAWSLLGYCMYMQQDWAGASGCATELSKDTPRTFSLLQLSADPELALVLGICRSHVSTSYEKLARLYPDVEEYRLYYAQCLHKSGDYAQAQKACLAVDGPELSSKVSKLQAAIKYETNDLVSCKILVEQGSKDDTDTVVNQGCLLYKVPQMLTVAVVVLLLHKAVVLAALCENLLWALCKDGRYEEAIIRFNEAVKLAGSSPELSYNVALCYYHLRQNALALKHIADIIERAVKEHPGEA
ncbi:MAG: hypothetical protein BJ554DRAFT_3211 [Olpidium bornovanus]|uniref:Uncharacterized protein n=1 Tax=Olpidium bornovanus TaxID=278681 RepID=A0A8H8DMW6_9FUNG|nr:MAG: hypothetical protein BJ554DRAFT_3211 [Olpidium bornovanus]